MHPVTGLMWETEHGPLGGDEINIVKPGRNYGWPLVTFGRDYDGTTADKLFASAKQLPGPGGAPDSGTKARALDRHEGAGDKDAPERTWQDLVDIAYLFRLDGVSRDEVKHYFVSAGLLDKWYELTQSR